MRSRSRKRSLVRSRSAPGKGNAEGTEPAAMRMRRPVRRSSPTASVVGPTKRAFPWNCSTPIFAQLCSVCSVVLPIIERLKRMSSGQSRTSDPAGTPLSTRSRAPWTASAALTRIFFGTQPRSAQVPPNGCRSTTATLQPASRHRVATAEAMPVPTTTRSYCLSMAGFPPQRAPKLGPARAPPALHLAQVLLLVGPTGHREPLHQRVRVGGIAERPGGQAPHPLDELGAGSRHAPEQLGQPVAPRPRDGARVEPVGNGHALEPDDTISAPSLDETEASQGLLVAAQQMSEHVLHGPSVQCSWAQHLVLGNPGDQREHGAADGDHAADRLTAPSGHRSGGSSGHGAPTIAMASALDKLTPRSYRPVISRSSRTQSEHRCGGRPWKRRISPSSTVTAMSWSRPRSGTSTCPAPSDRG